MPTPLKARTAGLLLERFSCRIRTSICGASHSRKTSIRRRWLDGLPAELRPCETALRFARIANRLAELWATPPLCLQYLDELCFDRRGGRQGFPLGVAAELLALKAYLEPELERCEMAWAFEREEKYDPASLASIEEDLGTILSQPLPQEALPDSLDDSE